jgi:uncharacterized protein DUF4136
MRAAMPVARGDLLAAHRPAMHMEIRISIAFALLLPATIACAQNVKVDFHQSAPFATYKTYAWAQGMPAASPFAEQRIHAEVDAQLGAKGLQPADGAPDLFVATHVITQRHSELIVNEFGWGLGGGTARRYTVGTLIVDLYDAMTRQLVWRGVGSESVSVKPRKNAYRLFDALEKMFAKYPPP